MKQTKRRMLAEWESQHAIQLTWPHAHTDWAYMLPEITAVYQQLAYEIQKHEELIIVAPEGTPLPNSSHVVTCPTNDTWARDHGFITVEELPTEDSEERTLRLLDFQFNGWGEKFAASLDNQINRHLYAQHILDGDYESHLDFVLEGGSIESDGHGTIFTTEGCLMAPHRNQPLRKEEIELRLKKWLGAERIVWLQHGSLLGDDTDGHIDTIVRIAPNNTLLYIGADEAHPDLELLEQELQHLRTLEGEPYRLLKLPLPRPIYDEVPGLQNTNDTQEKTEQRLPATYANYLVINHAVLVPTYAQPDLDAEALRTIALAFPEREVVGIDCRAIIRQHGSLHCCTMQYY